MEKLDIEAQSTHQLHTRSKHLVFYATELILLCYISYLSLSWFDINIIPTDLTTISTNYKLDYNISKSILLDALETNYAGKWMKEYTKENQLAGTNLKMVNFTLNKFTEFGLNDAYVDQYTSLISYPIDNSLNLISNESIVYSPSLIEDEIDEDPNSLKKVPAFLGYAGNGNVTAEYVYCNYGTFEDFQKLKDLGVNLNGKIAIVRYGAIFRGLKVKFAQDNGMVGVLIYTDIYDDGEVIEENGYKPYPKGYARNPSAIQRGSVQFLSMTPGDPTTPGYAIKPGEEKEKDRLDPHKVIPKIPALPISFKEVQPILSKLSGYGEKIEGWDGLVKNFDYSTGPNPNFKLNLYNHQDFKIATMNNIMGKIKGIDDSKFILIGNHHDSWTPAAGDPHSGSSTLLEIIRAFNELLKTGWKPKISIIFASWDGEEYGLIGSTEFAEYYEFQLKKKCVSYINADVSTIGSILKLHSSPLLNEVLLKSAMELPFPNSNQTLYENFISNNGKIGTLGSGSDYTVFLDHLGIPSVDLGFSNDLKNSPVYQYHSLYDSIYWMENFGDPDYIFHNLMSKLMSLIILHLSDDPVLNLRLTDYSIALKQYFGDLKIPKEWISPKKHCKQRMAHYHNVKPIIKSINRKLAKLNDKSITFDEHLGFLVSEHKRWNELSYWERIKLHFKTKASNTVLRFYERHLLDNEGLNDRPWYKHFVYASGRYTGYKGQELPSLAEAIEDHNLEDFNHRLRKFDSILSTLIRMSSL